MLFNSLEFLIFFPIVFCVYWNIRNTRAQNAMLVLVSYFFYGWWDWRFLGLIFVSSAVDFTLGRLIHRTDEQSKRLRLLIVSLVVNLGILGFFKYYNFFIDSFADLLGTVGLQANYSSLQVILPVGISFYTFQTLSYTIDIYRRRIEPTKDVIAFFAFVSFFPQLVAGPIERAKNLIPQFLRQRTFDPGAASDGFRQILWGFFKKVVIADNCAFIVDACFADPAGMQPLFLVIGLVCFAFQIYCDFSGYSDIAIGTARLLGFNLMQNFAYPYFSRDIAEFWRRWHISLSTWFRDYVYIPLGGSYSSKWKRIRNILITFVVSGFWHGANWTFVFWGFLHGLYYIPLMLTGGQKRHKGPLAEGRLLPTFRTAGMMLLTFLLTLVAWTFFRATSINEAFEYLGSIFTGSGTNGVQRMTTLFVVLMIAGMLVIEWIQRSKPHGLEIASFPIVARWSTYVLLIAVCLWFYGEQQAFIYFQF